MGINIFLSCIIVIFMSLFLVKVTESRCTGGYEELAGDCYKCYEEFGANKALAEQVCNNDGAHLAYIPDCYKFQSVIAYLRTIPPPEESGFWIGATDEDEEGYWVWGNGYPVRMGVPFWGTSGENWDPEPNGGSSQNCAQLSISDQYYFHDEDCDGYGSPLCQKDVEQETDIHSQSLPELNRLKEKGYNAEDASCPENFVYIGKSCFFFGTDVVKMTFGDAESFCQTKNATLSVLSDCFEFQELVEEIEKHYALETNESYWVGARDVKIEGSWLWNNYTDLEDGPPFWGSTNGIPEPSGGGEQNCAIMYKNDRYYFHDGECNKGTKVICQTPPTISAKRSGYP